MALKASKAVPKIYSNSSSQLPLPKDFNFNGFLIASNRKLLKRPWNTSLVWIPALKVVDL